MPPVSGNEHHDRLAALSEGERNKAFAEMLGSQCGQVSRTYFQGLGEANEAYWNVGCSSGDKIVGVAADSSTRVAPCESGKTIGMECWKEWEPAS